MPPRKITPEQAKNKAQAYCPRCRTFTTCKPMPVNTVTECWACDWGDMMPIADAIHKGYLEVVNV